MSRMFFLLLAFVFLLLVGCSQELNRFGADPENVVEAVEPWLVSGDCSRNFDGSIGSSVEVRPVESEFGIRLSHGHPQRLVASGVKVVDCVYTQQTHIARDAWGNLADSFPIGSWGTYYTRKESIEHPAQYLPGLVLPDKPGFAQADGTLVQSAQFVAPNEVVSITWYVIHLPYEENLEIHVTGISRSRYSFEDTPYRIIDKILGGDIEVIQYE